VLTALRPVTKGKLRVVFGCGGDRDAQKRPKMAAVACKLADLIVVTSDNPRTEDPQAIIHAILQGVPAEALPRVTVEPDRARAIAVAIAAADRDDVVLLAGKGHEDYQIIGKTKHPFDDRLHAAAALRRRVASAQRCQPSM
jgi:UDP-N-acetylmuramoyl-L-alanyl-D-glutamate--2,6-diaminopimelate ligase